MVKKICIIEAFLVLTVWFVLFVSGAKAEPPLNLSQYASQIVGKPIKVHCSYSRDNYGWTILGTSDIFLDRGTCEELRLLHRREFKSYKLEANALVTLVHESYHLKMDSGDESKVECNAMYDIRRYIGAYHFRRGIAYRLYRDAWLMHLGSADVYTRECAIMPGLKIGPVERPKG